MDPACSDRWLPLCTYRLLHGGVGGGWNAMREVSAYVTVLESADKLALLVRGLDNGD